MWCLLEGKEKTPEEVDVLIGGGSRYDVRMGKNFGLVVIGALLLTGCASGESEAAPAPTVMATPEAMASTEAAPLAAQAEPAATEEAPAADPEAAFLGSMERNWMGTLPASAELLAAGSYACDQLAAGLGHSDFRAVEGDSDAAAENHLLVTLKASETLCSEYNLVN